MPNPRVVVIAGKMYKFAHNASDAEIAAKIKAIRAGEQAFPILTGANKQADAAGVEKTTTAATGAEEAFPILKQKGPPGDDDILEARKTPSAYRPDPKIISLFDENGVADADEALDYLQGYFKSDMASEVLNVLEMAHRAFGKEGGATFVLKGDQKTLSRFAGEPIGRSTMGIQWTNNLNNKSVIALKDKSGLNPTILFHEFLHHGTSQVISLVEKGLIPVDTPLYKAVTELTKELDNVALSSEVLALMKGRSKLKGRGLRENWAPMKNTHEFLAYSLSDPVVFQTLSEVPTLQGPLYKTLARMNDRLIEGFDTADEAIAAETRFSNIAKTAKPGDFDAGYRDVFTKGMRVLLERAKVLPGDMERYRKAWLDAHFTEEVDPNSAKALVAFAIGGGGLKGLIQWKNEEENGPTIIDLEAAGGM